MQTHEGTHHFAPPPVVPYQTYNNPNITQIDESRPDLRATQIRYCSSDQHFPQYPNDFSLGLIPDYIHWQTTQTPGGFSH